MASISIGRITLKEAAVGQPLGGSKHRWPLGVYWNWTKGSHHCILFEEQNLPEEIQAVKQGQIEIALAVQPHSLWLIFRPICLKSEFDPMDWHVVPYNWHILTESMQEWGIPPDPATLTDARDVLTLLLADSETGIVRAIRQIELSPVMTRTLYQAIREQSARPHEEECKAFGHEADDLFDRFAENLDDCIHLASAWQRVPALVSYMNEKQGKSEQLRNFRVYKEASRVKQAQLMTALTKPQYTQFSGLELYYALNHVTDMELRPSAVAMLQELLSTHAERTIAPVVIGKLFPPQGHQWFTFLQPLQTAYGPVGALFLKKQFHRPDLEAIAASWTTTKRAAFFQYMEEIQRVDDTFWLITLVSPMGDGQIAHFRFRPPFSWQKGAPGIEACPLYTCVGMQACETCQHMEGEVGRILLLLEAMLFGVFREVIEVREETRTEKRTIAGKNGHKSKKVDASYKVQVLDVSRRRKVISPEEQEELKKKRYSWTEGKKIILDTEIDWNNPPDPDTVILAPRGVKGFSYQRTYRDASHWREDLLNTTIDVIVPAFTKPRQPVTYKRWKERMIGEMQEVIELIASSHEGKQQ